MLHTLLHTCHQKTVLCTALVPGTSLGGKAGMPGSDVCPVTVQRDLRDLALLLPHLPLFLLPRLAISAFHPTQTLLLVVSIQAVMLTEEKWWGRSQEAPESTEICTLNRSNNPEDYYPFSPKPSCSFIFPPHQDKSGGLCLYLWRKSLTFPFQPSFQAQHN